MTHVASGGAEAEESVPAVAWESHSTSSADAAVAGRIRTWKACWPPVVEPVHDTTGVKDPAGDATDTDDTDGGVIAATVTGDHADHTPPSDVCTETT